MGNMPNTEFFILLGTVLTGVIWQRVENAQLGGRIDRVRDDLSARLDHVRGELAGRIDGIRDDSRNAITNAVAMIPRLKC